MLFPAGEEAVLAAASAFKAGGTAITVGGMSIATKAELALGPGDGSGVMVGLGEVVVVGVAP